MDSLSISGDARRKLILTADAKTFYSVKKHETEENNQWELSFVDSLFMMYRLRKKIGKAKADCMEYQLEVLFLQYNTLLFNCEKYFNEMINFRLFNEFIVPLFEGKPFDQYLIILMVRSLGAIS